MYLGKRTPIDSYFSQFGWFGRSPLFSAQVADYRISSILCKAPVWEDQRFPWIHLVYVWLILSHFGDWVETFDNITQMIISKMIQRTLHRWWYNPSLAGSRVPRQNGFILVTSGAGPILGRSPVPNHPRRSTWCYLRMDGDAMICVHMFNIRSMFKYICLSSRCSDMDRILFSYYMLRHCIPMMGAFSDIQPWLNIDCNDFIFNLIIAVVVSTKKAHPSAPRKIVSHCSI